jgi:hypothetical protein
MIKALMPAQTFRMPASYLRRQCALLTAFSAVGVLLWATFGQVGPQAGAAFAGLVLLAFLAVYPLLRLRVWVTLSGAGMQGRGILGDRRALIAWSEPVTVEEYTPRRGAPGVRVSRFNSRGGQRGFHSMFIPYPILRDSSFRAALVRVAPSDHPLLTWQQFRDAAVEQG